MDRQSRELLVGVVAVVALAANVESFSLRHFPLGVLLCLFLYGGLNKKGSTYEQICYAVVAGFCALLTMGYFVQAGLNALHWGHRSEVIYLGLVALIAIGVFFGRVRLVRETTQEEE